MAGTIDDLMMRIAPARLALLLASFISANASLSVRASGRAAEIPVVSGLTFVLAVHNPNAASAGSRIAHSDYEMVVRVGAVAADSITLKTTSDAEDGLI
jgi:hypothetical protein